MSKNAIDAINNMDLYDHPDQNGIIMYMISIKEALKEKIYGTEMGNIDLHSRVGPDKEAIHEILMGDSVLLRIICMGNKYPVKFITYNNGISMGILHEPYLDKVVMNMIQEPEFVDFVKHHMIRMLRKLNIFQKKLKDVQISKTLLI